MKLLSLLALLVLSSGCTPTRYIQDTNNSLEEINRALEGEEVAIRHVNSPFSIQAQNVVLAPDSVRYERSSRTETMAFDKVQRIWKREGSGASGAFLMPLIAGGTLTAIGYKDHQNCEGAICAAGGAALVSFAGLTVVVSVVAGMLGSRLDRRTVYFDRRKPPPAIRAPVRPAPAVPGNVIQ
ncbi:MAG: hypothetical protein AAF752_01545 [Bacteroidota bacterium]